MPGSVPELQQSSLEGAGAAYRKRAAVVCRLNGGSHAGGGGSLWHLDDR